MLTFTEVNRLIRETNVAILQCRRADWPKWEASFRKRLDSLQKLARKKAPEEGVEPDVEVKQ